MEKKGSVKKEKRRFLGHELVKAGVITAKQLKFVLKEQRKLSGDGRERIGEILLKTGLVDEKTMIGFLEKYLGIPYVKLTSEANIDPHAVKLIPERMARHIKAIAIGFNKKNNKLIVAMNNPYDIVTLDTIRMKTGFEIERCFSLGKEIENAIDRFYVETAIKKSVQDFIDKRSGEEPWHAESAGTAHMAATDENTLEAEAVKTPVIEFVNRLLSDAIQHRASDIHVEPRENELCIRYRIDGILRQTFPPPKEMQPAIITRLKLLGDMNIAETRLPQDGRFKFRFRDRDIDMRMASSPTIYGEKLVLRILDSSSLLLEMDELGLSEKNIEEFKAILKQPYGLILVTGPTGSGKTTTLYTALNYINTPDKNIFTIEDPVEYQLHGINQIQTKHQIGFTFASGLRTVLRQDPDIIMIGEIRDLETLENAIKASLTGHLVLSTIHTNDAPSVVMRLLHMGLEPYLISSCLSLVIAQRLVRKICGHCKERITLSPSMVEGLESRTHMDIGSLSFYQGKGCDNCNKTGYLGRTGLYEFMMVSKNMRSIILEGASELAVRELAIKEGMGTIFQGGMDKVHKGLTTIEEVLRVTVLEKSIDIV